MMNQRNFAIPESVTPDGIRRLRKKCALSRQEFAELMRVSVKTVESWENGKNEVKGPLCFALKILLESPEIIGDLELPPQKTSLRLLYRTADEICTVIDVDEMHRKVFIKNYTGNLLHRAFGSIEKPTYDEYEEFLKERCFPETRDKMKLMLENLNIPFYDPLLIIEKTGGRMAEDNFYVEVIRK